MRVMHLSALTVLAFAVTSCCEREVSSRRDTSGLYPVKEGAKWGYIDKVGNMILEPRFDAAESYSEGLAAVLVGGRRGKWGFIDRNGKVVVQTVCEQVLPFSSGVAAVRIEGRWGYVDNKGQILLPPSFDRAGLFSAGFAAVHIGGRGGKRVSSTSRGR